MNNNYIIALISFTLQFNLIFSQSEENKSIEIETNDGNIFLGEIIEENEEHYKIVSKDGIEIVVPKSSVKKIEYMIITEVDGEVWRPDPNKSMYLFAPSAYPIEKNKAYCRDFCLFFPSYNRGVGNNISVQAGAFIIPSADIGSLPIILSGKYSFPSISATRFAAGIMYINFPFGEEESFGGGIAFGTATYGNRFRHITASLGWGYVQSDGDWYFAEEPMLVLASNYRTSNTFSIIAELWKFPQSSIENIPLMVAGRFIGRKIAVDLGFILSIELASVPPPLLNFTYYMN